MPPRQTLQRQTVDELPLFQQTKFYTDPAYGEVHFLRQGRRPELFGSTSSPARRSMARISCGR